MTRETLQEANKLGHTITNLETQIRVVEDMFHCDNDLHLRCEQLGEITIAGDDELKDDILNMVLNSLKNKKEYLEDQFRMM